MRNFHLLFLSVIFICGVLVGSSGIFGHIPPYFIPVSVVALFAFLRLSVKRDFFFLLFLSLLVFILGAVRYNVFNRIDRDSIKNYASYSQDAVLVRGRVVSDPGESPAGKKETFVLEANSIKSEGLWKRTDGFLLVNLYGKSSPAIRHGDIVILKGTLLRPFSYKRARGFDYAKYLENKRIYFILSVRKEFLAEKIGEDGKLATRFVRAIYSLRAKIEAHIERFLKPPYSAVLTAILLGKRQKIPPGLRDSFVKTGTLHILAISGLHVGIIYFALRVILKILRIHRNPSIILSVLFLLCFAILAGARPSILRAATMFSIIAFGELLKRKISIFNLIGLSCLVILLVNPNQVFDAGFILSYAAVLSIVGVSPFFYRLFSAEGALEKSAALQSRVRYYLSGSVSVSLAAWIGLIPLIAYYFGLISPIVVIANLVVIPLLLMVMGTGLLFVSFGFFSESAAFVFSQSAWFFIFVLTKSVRFLKDIPFGYFEIKTPRIYSVILYYILLLAAMRFAAARLKD